MSYSIENFETLPWDSLKPHPAAEIPIDEADYARIVASVKREGLLQPLLVSAEPDRTDGCRWIYDGVNRWNAAQDACVLEIPCLLVRTDDPASVVEETLTATRQRSTGQRIMVYLERHKEQVLDAYRKGLEVGNGRIRNAANRLQKAVVSRETTDAQEWGSQPIAKRLGVSKQDVLCGLELLRAIEDRRMVAVGLVGERDADEETVELLRERRNRILAGGSPIRVWKRAFGGAVRTKGEVRAPVQWGEVLVRGIRSATGGMDRWRSLDADYRKEIAGFVDKFVRSLPDELVDVVRAAVEDR